MVVLAATTAGALAVPHMFANARFVSSFDLTDHKPVLIIAPHADDETLGCGGLISQLARADVPVTVALLTDGSRSHRGSLLYPPDKLCTLRENELRNALIQLGATKADVMLFRQPDGFLNRSDHRSITNQLTAAVRARDIRTVFVTWAADPHPDHQAAAAIAGQLVADNPALDLYAYPIWGLTLPSNTVDATEQARAVRLDVGAQQRAKLAAIFAHASQTTDLIDDCADPFQLSSDDISLFCGPFETFIPMHKGGTSSRAVAGSVPLDHFEALYARAPDPWEYETNAYEQEKYRRILSMLPRERYARGLELGCSIGVLTALLATRCDELVGLDGVPAAVEAARQRLQYTPHVHIVQGQLPSALPEGTFDLIVLSEVLYFFVDEDLAVIADFVIEHLRPGGTCILVNFLGDTESPQTGDDAAAIVIQRCASTMAIAAQFRHEHYRIDVLVQRDAAIA